jgi:hypothetical protein
LKVKNRLRGTETQENLKPFAIECGDTPIDRIWDILFCEDYGRWIKEVWCIYGINDGNIEIVKFVKPPKLLEYEREIGWFKE